MISLQVDDQTKTLLATLAPAQINKVTGRALNNSQRYGKQTALQSLSSHYSVPQYRFKRRVFARAKPQEGKASVWVGLNKMPLVYFKKHWKKVGRGIKTQGHDQAFLATMSNGHKGIFERKTQARLPIAEVQKSLSDAGQLLQSRLSRSLQRYFHQALENGLRDLTSE